MSKYESLKELKDDVKFVLERMSCTEYQVFRPVFDDFCRVYDSLTVMRDLLNTMSERADWKE